MERRVSSSHATNDNGPSTLRTDELDAAARSLLQSSVGATDGVFRFGSMSCSIYDTAFVSLVTKVIDGKCQWLLPRCFDYLLDSQSEEGSWGETASQVDGILSTAAALLSLLRHRAQPLQLEHVDTMGLGDRIERAVSSLRSMLRSWAVGSTVQVGFEVTVPALIGLLVREDPSLDFQFDGFHQLMKINAQKLSHFRPDDLYGNMRSTVFHSLEAFMDKIDFDRIAHHTTFGSMMGSPSSTSAYLMKASRWDDEAEPYLKDVVENAAGKASGGVPSAYPL